jgi:uncharacterized protein DUF6496
LPQALGRRSGDKDQFAEGRTMMARYGKAAGKTVKSAMHRMKRGKLKSGRSNKPVKSRKQAIAIGLSEARKKGAKVPRKPPSSGKKIQGG